MAPTVAIKAVEAAKSEKKQSNKDLQKTRLCVYNLEGKCGFGSSCSFAHSATEMRGVPNLQKTQLCAKFMEGKCSDANCTFAHGLEELKDSPNFKRKICKWASKGACRNGTKCGFAHQMSELRNMDPPPGFGKVPNPKVPPPPGLEKMGPDEQADLEMSSTEAPPSLKSDVKSSVSSQPDAQLFHMVAARGAAPLNQQVVLMSSAIGALQAKLASLEDMVLQSQVAAMQQQIQQLNEQCWALEAGMGSMSAVEQLLPEVSAKSTKLNSKASPFVPFMPINDQACEASDDSTSVGSGTGSD